jgi:hypothetical protein
MSELLKIVLTAGLTIFGGIGILVLQRFFVEPIQEYEKVIGEVAYALIFYADVYMNSSGVPFGLPDPLDRPATETASALRQSASKLIATTAAIRWWWLARSLHVPPRESAIQAAVKLIRMSNSVRSDREGNEEARARIADLLGLTLPWPKPQTDLSVPATVGQRGRGRQ